MRSVKATAKAGRSRAQTARRPAPPVARVTAIKTKARHEDDTALWLRILKAPLKLIGIRRPMLIASLVLAALTLIVAIIVSGVIGRTIDAGERGLGVLATKAGFGISEVHLAGAKRTPPQTVLATLGFHLGQSVFGADVHAARDRLMALDWIKSVDVRRRYPDDITVTVTEKQPFALWRDAAGHIWVIEKDGALITDQGYEEFLKLPHFIGTGAPQGAAEMIEALPGHRAVIARLKGMQRVGERRWNLVLDNGVVVQLPEKGWHKQLNALESLIVDKGILERDVTQIDLRSPTTYFFLLKGGNKQQVQRGEICLMGETVRMRTGSAEQVGYRTGLVAALDVGSSKIVCLIGRAEPGQLRVLGAALRESQGIKAGTITSLDLAEESIRDAVAAAENHADARIQNVIIGINCGQPVNITSRNVMTLDGALVTDAHLRALLADGRAKCTRDGYEIIQSAPTAYVVDEARGVRDPSGMFCQRIGVAMHAVGVKPSPLQNLKLAIERCHLSISGTLFAPFASGLATLTPDEMQLGATVIDLGGGVTSIAVFMEGQLAYADVVPMGGLQVTSDLARMLAAPLSAAERAKTLHGAALGDLEYGADVVTLPQMGEDADGGMRVPRSMLTRIIQARMEEILGEVQTRLRASGYDVAAGRRAVLTGGGSQLSGVRELAARILNKQVRIGRPQAFAGLPAASASPDYATAVGLLMAGATMPPELLNPDLALEAEEPGAQRFLWPVNEPVTWVNKELTDEALQR